MVAIVVINYHSEDLTIHFVNEELSKVNGDCRIVIVNNGATADTDNQLSNALSAPVVTINTKVETEERCVVLSSEENLGFARGNNLAVQFVLNNFNADYILFTNNDIQIVQPTVLQTLVEKLESHPEVGMIGPKVVGLDGKLQSPEPYVKFWDRYVWMYLSTPFYSRLKKIKRFKLDYPEDASEGYHYKVMGSFFMVRTSDFVQCGMMDPNTFLYAEEVILSERMKAIGKGVYYTPEVEVIHAHGATTKKTIGNGRINSFMLQSECYYYSHYMHEPSWKIYLGKSVYKLIGMLRK